MEECYLTMISLGLALIQTMFLNLPCNIRLQAAPWMPVLRSMQAEWMLSMLRHTRCWEDSDTTDRANVRKILPNNIGRTSIKNS